MSPRSQGLWVLQEVTARPRARAHLLKDLADGFVLVHLLPGQNLLEPLVHFSHAARETAQLLTEHFLSTYCVLGTLEETEINTPQHS